MSTRRPIPIEEAKRLVLGRIYHAFINDLAEFPVQLDELIPIISVEVSKNMTRKIISQFVSDGLLERYQEETGGDFFHDFTEKGLVLIDEELKDLGSPVRRVAHEISDIDSNEELDEWKPLNIDRNDQKYSDAISAVENAITIIKNDNGYAATHPDERTAIVESIEFGIEKLKKGYLTLSGIRTLVLQPLQYIARKFSEAMIGEAAKAAVGAVVRWLTGLL